jgi:hypothetical protein
MNTPVEANSSDSCKKQYKRYNKVVYDYRLRIEDKTDKYGCDVVLLYSKMIQLKDMETFMDVLDENPTMIPAVKRVLTHKNIVKILSRYPALKKSLFNQSTTTVFIDNFYTVAKKYMNYAMTNKILNQPEYFNYFLISAKTAVSNKEAISNYTLLRKTLSVEQLSLFFVFYNATKEELSFRELISNIKTLQESLDHKESQEILSYPQYMGYLFKNISEHENEEFAKNYQLLSISIFKKMYEKYRYDKDVDQIQLALKTVENISPYLKSQPLKSIEPFRSIIKDLISKDFILQLFDDGLCSNKTTNNFAIFGKDNIYNIILLKQNHPFLYEVLIDKRDTYRSIYSLFYVANALNTLPSNQAKVFLTLLEELPGESIYTKIPFIHRLEKMSYLRHIVRRRDYDKYISASADDIRGKSTMKFVYILLTSYPKQTDLSIVDRYYSGKFDESTVRKHLYSLENMSVDELEDHCFTFAEKVEIYVDVADYSMMVVAIAATPFTGGVSLGYVSSSVAKKVATKSLKYMVKKSIRTLNKGIKYVNKTKRSAVKKFGKSKVEKAGKKIDGSEEWIDNGSDLFFMGNVLLLGSNIKTKNICEEIK